MSEWFLSLNPKAVHMQMKETVSEGKKWIRSNAPGGQEEDQEPASTTLTGEEKKIFDAAFAGAIIGASLTALIFIFL